MRFTSLILMGAICVSPAFAAPLPSWNATESKDKIITFVESVTTEDSPDFIPLAERIAVFDNDGTLWGEQPMYFQLFYAIDRVKALADQHPEWKEEEPFASVLKGDLKGVAASGHEGLLKLIMATHAGMTEQEFRTAVKEWLATAKHPETGRSFDSMTYQPMLELLDYLRANGFKTFIVSGGGIDFIRVFSEEAYGIPPEQVMGSSINAKYEMRDGKPVVVKLAEIDLIDDKAGKPVGIHRQIGQRPVMAFGNSDGDFEMLEYTTTGDGARLGVLIHHNDAEREFAYDRDSPIGKLVRGLDEADERGWVIVDMKEDWKTIYPRE